VAGGWRRLHNEELHNLYASPNIVRMIRSRRMRWAEHVARMEKMRKAYRSMVGNLKGRYHAEDLGIDGNIILEKILGMYGGQVWNRFIWLRLGTSVGLM
jgi:hypothetical protein